MVNRHPAVSAVVRAQDRYLILKKQGDGASYWQLPGGTVEDESAEQALFREIYEETDLEPEDMSSVRPFQPYELDTNRMRYTVFPFKVEIDEWQEIECSEENKTYDWATWTELEELRQKGTFDRPYTDNLDYVEFPGAQELRMESAGDNILNVPSEQSVREFLD